MNEAQPRHLPRRLEFRIAREPWELEQIHRLNYVTFTEEIPQYGPEESRRRVDKFHDQNVYASASDERVVGMIADRLERPFSVEAKLSGFEAYVPAGRRLCELRLLAVEEEFRGGAALAGLIGEVWKSAERGFLVAWESSYLRTRNWIQIALMGEVTRAGVKALLRALRQVLRECDCR